ncbi:hypothetical protein ADK43_37540 [Streptomyces rimosus subsp. rimosus]|nr:hypothetical protein ADK43_37540 [Streptomyces rimosus subsp. rimosus]
MRFWICAVRALMSLVFRRASFLALFFFLFLLRNPRLSALRASLLISPVRSSPMSSRFFLRRLDIWPSFPRV